MSVSQINKINIPISVPTSFEEGLNDLNAIKTLVEDTRSKFAIEGYPSFAAIQIGTNLGLLSDRISTLRDSITSLSKAKNVPDTLRQNTLQKVVTIANEFTALQKRIDSLEKTTVTAPEYKPAFRGTTADIFTTGELVDHIIGILGTPPKRRSPNSSPDEKRRRIAYERPLLLSSRVLFKPEQKRIAFYNDPLGSFYKRPN